MSTPNGHAPAPVQHSNGSPKIPLVLATSSGQQLSTETIQEIVRGLEVPFDPVVIEWRVTNTMQDKSRGQVIPYADQRAYTDRLNALFTPAGWTRKYSVHTSANFERSKDKRVVAKVLVTCELTIGGLGSHSATGEEWADDENAGTSAEAQAFKRACSCFGLGRYLYYFAGIWVDLDQRKRPKKNPKLPDWATPAGWQRGLRPPGKAEGDASAQACTMEGRSAQGSSRNGPPAGNVDLLHQIEAMAEPLGRKMYRGLLKALARVWDPKQIDDPSLLQKVLTHMQAAQRGFARLDAALERTGPEALGPILESLRLRSTDQVDSLDTLQKIVLAMEAKSGSGPQRA
jgi:hypothetical protein